MKQHDTVMRHYSQDDDEYDGDPGEGVDMQKIMDDLGEILRALVDTPPDDAPGE